MNVRAWTIAATIALAGCGSDEGEVVRAYCSYGAVSQAQLDGCIEHVGAEQARSYDTNAGAYARGELGRCLDDAGPYCVNREDLGNGREGSSRLDY